jgi:hypothetical protein
VLFGDRCNNLKQWKISKGIKTANPNNCKNNNWLPTVTNFATSILLGRKTNTI